MATFLVSQQELADRLSLDQTVSAQATRLKRWLNLIYQDFCSRYNWSFLQERAIVQTSTQKTGGTIAVTNGSTSVVGTSTSFVSGDKRSFLQISGDRNWYEVTAVSSQTLTISPAFGGTTNSAASYTLTQVFYDLGTDVHQVIDVRQHVTPFKLTNIGNWTIDMYRPDSTILTGPPTGYSLFRLDPDVTATSSKQIQMSFFPIADAVYNIEVRYRKILADLSADGDIAQIPVQYHAVTIDGAEWLGAKFLNLPNQDALKTAYEFGVEKAIEADSRFNDHFPVLGSADDKTSNRFLPFPAHYEQPR